MIITNMEILKIILSCLFPVILIVGSYIALKSDVIRNQERIAALKEDITEIKSDVKYIRNKIMTN